MQYPKRTIFFVCDELSTNEESFFVSDELSTNEEIFFVSDDRGREVCRTRHFKSVKYGI